MIVITGWHSEIATAFRAMLPAREAPVWGMATKPGFPLDADRYLFCQGLLRPKRLEDQTPDERDESWEVNFASIARVCDGIIEGNHRARICVIGSESGYRDSFDGTYACAKARLHRYVEAKALRYPGQQLVALSPSIVGDAGMTTRRKDTDNLNRRLAAHPKGRFLRAREVAAMAHLLLYGEGMDYVTGTVIRMHGATQ